MTVTISGFEGDAKKVPEKCIGTICLVPNCLQGELVVSTVHVSVFETGVGTGPRARGEEVGDVQTRRFAYHL